MAEENSVKIEKVTEETDIESIPDNADLPIDFTIAENVRFLMRPFLTIFFPILFGVIVIISVLRDPSSTKDMLLAVDGILGAVMGYHFGKSSKIESIK